MSALLLSTIISLSHASTGLQPSVAEVPLFTPDLVVEQFDPLKLDTSDWLQYSSNTIRSGECYEKVKAATCKMPDLAIFTINWQKPGQHYRAILECRVADYEYMMTTPDNEESILTVGEKFCEDDRSVYVVFPADPD